MDIKGYIQSGIIEQYVLGLASAEEVAELEQLRAKYPELNEAILNFENQFEKHALANAVQLPVNIKTSLEKELFGNSSLEKDSEQNTARIYNINAWRY